MADGGFTLLWRKFFEHRYWTEKRVFNRSEAWIDCWANMAAFAEHERMVCGIMVTVHRGEFMASDRFLEQRWGWSRGKVRRFLDNCIDQNELIRVGESPRGADHPLNNRRTLNRPEGGTIYLVVNYDDYQPRSTNDDTNDGPATVPTTGPKINKGNKGIRNKESSSDEKSAVRVVFDYWVLKTGRTAKTKLTAERRKVIENRLESFVVDELQKAVDGVMKSEFHSAKPEYTDLISCFRNDSRVEQHIAHASGNGNGKKPHHTKATPTLFEYEGMTELPRQKTNGPEEE